MEEYFKKQLDDVTMYYLIDDRDRTELRMLEAGPNRFDTLSTCVFVEYNANLPKFKLKEQE